MNDKKSFCQKWLVQKQYLSEVKKKPTPRTNIPLLSLRKSEQLEDTKIHTIFEIQTNLLVSGQSPERFDCLFYGAVITVKKLKVIN